MGAIRPQLRGMTNGMTNDEIPNDQWNDEVRMTNRLAREDCGRSFPARPGIACEFFRHWVFRHSSFSA